MFSRTADHVRQHAAQELFAAVAAAQDDERAEVFRRLCNEVGHALDSVLVGLHRLGAPRNSSVEIPAMQDPIEELSDVIVKRFAEPVEWRSSYAAPRRPSRPNPRIGAIQAWFGALSDETIPSAVALRRWACIVATTNGNSTCPQL